MNQKEKDFYIKLRKKINRWLEENSGNNKYADYIMLAPDLFYLLVKLSTDPEVPRSKKIKLIAVIAYFISPIDLLPEAFLGPLGFADDIAAAAYVLNDIINDVDPQIVLKHWVGDSDLLYDIKTILANADKFVGTGLWKKIRAKF